MRIVFMRLGCLLFAGALFVLAACGDDEPSNNGGTPPPTDMGDADMGDATDATIEDFGMVDLPEDAGETPEDMSDAGEEDMRVLLDCVEFDPPLGVCDPLCQTGCEAGRHCITEQEAQTESPTITCDVSGTKGQEQQCVNSTECGVGFFCDEFEPGASACRQYCRPDSDIKPVCPSGFICQPFLAELRLGKCVEFMDECSVVPDTCDDGQNCYETDRGLRCAPFNSDATPDMTCTQSNECNDGFRCVDAGGELRCKPTCDPNATDDSCVGTETCHEIRDDGGNTLSWGACF